MARSELQEKSHAKKKTKNPVFPLYKWRQSAVVVRDPPATYTKSRQSRAATWVMGTKLHSTGKNVSPFSWRYGLESADQGPSLDRNITKWANMQHVLRDPAMTEKTQAWFSRNTNIILEYIQAWIQIWEVCKKSKWKFKMAFAIRRPPPPSPPP